MGHQSSREHKNGTTRTSRSHRSRHAAHQTPPYPRRSTVLSEKAGLLAHGSSHGGLLVDVENRLMRGILFPTRSCFATSPGPLMAVSSRLSIVTYGPAPHSQWRDRAGFSPASLFGSGQTTPPFPTVCRCPKVGSLYLIGFPIV
jgi:hypothetical protein